MDRFIANAALLAALLCLASFAGTASAQSSSSAPAGAAKPSGGTPATATPSVMAPSTAAAPSPGPLDRGIRRGSVLLTGQPRADELGTLGSRGISRVINLRTPEEMNDRAVVPFDQAALLDAADIDYVVIPIGGNNYPFRPEALEAYAKALEAANGEVLLHCASGGRASTLHAAYEVKYLGKSPDEAMRGLEAFGGWPLPMERLTGIPLKIERADAPAEPQKR